MGPANQAPGCSCHIRPPCHPHSQAPQPVTLGAYPPGIGYYELHATEYATKVWVREVADSVAAVINRIRPFTEDDILLDYGAGPGLTLESIFYFRSSMAPLLGRTAYAFDVNSDMVRKSSELASVRCPSKGVFCRRVNAFGEKLRCVCA